MDAIRSGRLLVAAAIVAAGLLVRPTHVEAQPDAEPPPEPGVEVLARGPVHEAFAEPIVFNATPGIVVEKEPPGPIEELPPDERPAGENIEWISGYWSWDADRSDYIWVSGFWRAVPQGRQWVPGYWTKAETGFQWVSGFWGAAGAESIDYLPAPPASLEVGASTPPPSLDHLWVPGCYYWRDARYLWRPGFWWISQPDWIWIPAHYVWTPCGYVFVDGYYDALVPRRGLLFAPVYFAPSVYARVGYFYSPYCVVDAAMFTDHFFVWPRTRHYYFGDYYAASYVQAGIVPWFAFHSGHGGYDPIYAFHRYQHRHDRDWDRGIRLAYERRRDHEHDRPERTFAALSAAAKKRGDSDGKHKVFVTTLGKISTAKDSPMHLEKVSKGQRDEIVKQTKETRLFVKKRVDLESKAKITLKGDDKGKGTDKGAKTVKTIKLDLPKSSTVSGVKTGKSGTTATIKAKSLTLPPQTPKTGSDAFLKKRVETVPSKTLPSKTVPLKTLPKKGDPKPSLKEPSKPKETSKPKELSKPKDLPKKGVQSKPPETKSDKDDSKKKKDDKKEKK